METEEDMFTKHAALIWQQDGCAIEKARWKAWCEGPKGYQERLKKEQEYREMGGK